MREECIENGVAVHNFNQRNLKIEEFNIVAENNSMKERRNDLVCSDDEIGDEAVGNMLEPTGEETENKMKSSLENELKKSLNN